MLHARRALSPTIFVNCVARSVYMSGYPFARKANSEYLHGRRKIRVVSSIAMKENTAYGYTIARKKSASKFLLYFSVRVLLPLTLPLLVLLLLLSLLLE